jgi:hypothetical protein
MRIFSVLIAALVVVSACSTREPSQQGSADTAGVKDSLAPPVTFINRVWVVAESDQVALGEVRVFLSDGTLVLTSPHGTPAFGTWNYQEGRLTITEESLKYDVDILELTRDTFRIRINSPGEPVVVRFAPAPQPTVPGK